MYITQKKFRISTHPHAHFQRFAQAEFALTLYNNAFKYAYYKFPLYLFLFSFSTIYYYLPLYLFLLNSSLSLQPTTLMILPSQNLLGDVG